MKESTNWGTEYQIIASGNGEKLEKWGNIYLLRPDPQAIWSPPFDLGGFRMLHAKYNRSQTGGGAWEYFKSIPDEWTINYRDLKFIISPTGFKHTGLFPEQAINWERIGKAIKKRIQSGQGGPKVLNLFGYTGGATVAAAYAMKDIAHGGTPLVTHVDASKGMTEVCKRNVDLNKIPKERTRYIVEDCARFVAREIRRGNKYDAIIMDPPSFGRGTAGEVWKIERDLDPLVRACCELLSDKPLFFLINSYTTGLQPTVIKNILKTNFDKAGRTDYTIDSYEIGLPTLEGITLPAGCSAFAEF